MAYRAGIDLGTTFTAAAIRRDGETKPEVVTLGSRGASIPTVRILVAEEGNRVIAISEDGTVAVFAGTGRGGYDGDGLEATRTQLFAPQGLAVDAEGRVLVADASNARVRQIG